MATTQTAPRTSIVKVVAASLIGTDGAFYNP